MTSEIMPADLLDADTLNNAANAGTSSVQQLEPDFGSTTSTSFTASLTSGTNPAVVFVAPPSGRVDIGWSCSMYNSTSGQFVNCSFEVRTGSSIGAGSVVEAASVYHQVGGKINFDMQVGDTYMLSGLTPGSTYHARQMYACSGGTGNYKWKKIKVVPAS